MAYCPNCGVELAPEAKACPLCGSAVGAPAGADRQAERIFDPEDREKLTDRERQTIVWEILSVSALIAAVAVSAVNLFVEGRLSWALYPLISLAFAWILMSSAFLLGRHPLLSALASALALPVFLLGLDLIGGGLSWSLLPALPIVLVVESSLALVSLFVVRSKRRSVNVIAFVLLGAVLICIGIEAILDLSYGIGLVLTWSSIVAFALVPVSAFLLYLHYRVGRRASLRKIFRL